MERLPSPFPTVYLDEPEDQSYIATRPLFQDPYPLQLWRPDRPKKECLTIPMSVHHLLRRQYVPYKAFLEKYSNIKESEVWIGVDMDRFCLDPRSREDFIACVQEAFQYSKFYMSENPKVAPCVDRGFWIQMRGYFPGPRFEMMMEAAKRHMQLVDRLIKAGYVIL
ncbi:hypothetical protein N7478_012221 [Penicillium angulare]|uniref:uncharacterized protein n=1 Tax=Penicillium angulare TaxID=116970 RepID=UPI00253FDB01|nr:uncharacterized protein N7478_012221 [Penicillium angulare]KAJ5259240.1 hypothetical protein N7478_012221 [Penicillium angulare]